MSVGIKDVAAHVGVSVGTVSNVLNRPDVVAPETRQRVLGAIEALGFVRNESARQLRAGRSRTIGMVVLDVANPFFTDVARGAQEVADAKGIMVMLCNTGEDPARERRHIDMLEQQRVMGVLITPVERRSPRLEQMVKRGTPVVLVDRGAGKRTRCSAAVDDVLGGRLAVAHLIDRGHRRLAFVGGPLAINQVADRHRGASDAIAASRGLVDELLVVETDSLSVAAGRAAGDELASLPRSRRPTAAFCANDLLALGVLEQVTRLGLRVPQDIALVGYDDIDFAASAAIPLSSVRQPREELGRTAAQLLIDEVEEGSRHRHRQVVFEPELIVRESSASRRRRARAVAAGASPGGGGRRTTATVTGSELGVATRAGTAQH